MKESQIVGLLTPLLAQHGLDLDAVEVIPAGRRSLLRIVVDGDGPKGTGLLLDDIAEATRAISVALDESPVVGSNPYTLEVTSRGVSRPLELPRHWRRNAGRLVAVTTADGEPFTGRVVSADETVVVLEVDGEHRELAQAAVTQALVQVELNRPKRTEEPADEDEDDADRDEADVNDTETEDN